MRTIHSHAVQFAASAMMATVVATALPSFAADIVAPTALPAPIDTYYAQAIVTNFRKAGSPYSFDNRTVETSAFDIQAYMRDTCYQPTAFDLAGCEYRYGPYNNLRTTIENGTLQRILKQYGIISTADQIVKIVGASASAVSPASSVSSVSSSAVSSTISSSVSPAKQDVLINTQQSYQQLLTDRAALLWKQCGRQYRDNADRAACYQRNFRLIQRTDVSIEQNVH